MPRGWESVATDPAPRRTDATPDAAAGPGLRIRVDVVASRRAEITLDLAPGAAAGSVVVQALRGTDPATPRLVDLALRSAVADEPPTLVVRIPEQQPPDVYRGAIVDATTGHLAGTLVIRLDA
jgi:hypothetical protein